VITRRRLLALSAAAATVLALPAGAAEPFEDGDSELIRALLAVIYGPGSERLDVVSDLAATLVFVDEDTRDKVRQLPWLLDELSRVLVPTVSAWHALPPEEQAAALEDWATSGLAFRRSVYVAVRKVLLFHAYLDERTWAEIGYPGPWLGRMELPVHPLRFGEP
jgi:hypothetical protein